MLSFNIQKRFAFIKENNQICHFSLNLEVAHLQWDYKDKTLPWMLHLFKRKKLQFSQVVEYQSLDNQQPAVHNLKPTQDCSQNQQTRQQLIRKDCLAVAAVQQVHLAYSELQDNHRVRICRLHRLNQVYLEHQKRQVGYSTHNNQQALLHCNLKMQIQLADSSVGQNHLLQGKVEYLVKTHSKIDLLL